MHSAAGVSVVVGVDVDVVEGLRIALYKKNLNGNPNFVYLYVGLAVAFVVIAEHASVPTAASDPPMTSLTKSMLLSFEPPPPNAGKLSSSTIFIECMQPYKGRL
jgi:hypothetical protein